MPLGTRVAGPREAGRSSPGDLLRRGRGLAVNRARDEVLPELVQVRPAGVSASSVLAGHPPGLAVDGVTTTWYAEGADGPGLGTELTLRFDRPVDLERVGVRTGVPGEAFTAQPRPARFEVRLSDGSTADLRLADTPDFQDLPLRGRAVTSLVLRLAAVHPGASGSDSALTELELFARH